MLECKRCGYQWLPRNKSKKPKTCPKCKSPYWQKPLTPYWKSVREKSNKDRVRNEIIDRAVALIESPYFLAASGCRDVYQEELIDVLNTLINVAPDRIKEKLKSLYDNHPDTIAMDRSLGYNR